MARGQLAQGTGTYVDLDLDFTRNPATNDISFKKDENAIRRSVRNLALTNIYERKFNPDIGSGVYNMLFENITPVTALHLQRAVKEVLVVYEPRVEVLGVNLVPKYDENGYECTINFNILAIQKQLTISLFLERLN